MKTAASGSGRIHVKFSKMFGMLDFASDMHAKQMC